MGNQALFDKEIYPYKRSIDQDCDQPARHNVVIVGAGPVGLAAAIDLASNDIAVLVIDDNDRVSSGSRAICFAKRTLEILDRLGCGEEFVEKGVTWNIGKVFRDTDEIYAFNLLEEKGHKRPAFINLQQYYLEDFLVQRVRDLQALGKPLELRGKNKVTDLAREADYSRLTIETPEGQYQIDADWVIACDGANSPIRNMLGLDFVGRTFQDHFLIADVVMEADFPTERWFWFNPPFNRGQSALLHKQPDNVWRIDFQLGWDIDKEHETKPENVKSRLSAMLGEDVKFELEWVSLYTFQSRRMEKFRHGRVLFAGDSAHQVSPFGARGANSGLQDVDNLCWKLKLVLEGKASSDLLDSYNDERVFGAQENILNSSRSTDFITPKSDVSRIFRDAVLSLCETTIFSRQLVNTGRLSIPCIYDDMALNGNDVAAMPHRSRPGSSIIDAPVEDRWLGDLTGNRFQLLAIEVDVPEYLELEGIKIDILTVSKNAEIAERYLGSACSAVYLLRPDQHIVARWEFFDEAAITSAIRSITSFKSDEIHD